MSRKKKKKKKKNTEELRKEGKDVRGGGVVFSSWMA